VSATEAAKRLGTLIDRVRDERATYTIERGGTPVARLEPVETIHCSLSEFVALLEGLESPDPDYFEQVEQAVDELNRPAAPGTEWES
jgi:antitoxin (DNA-binding transcriptional repressor) of toxin-antitoxin stability system